MPRQKFCSVPGCLSTTELVKREQESFLAAPCDRCSSSRPCRCPAPDIYTTRKETKTKFTSWCDAIGLKDPGYYVNVCHKHFSAGSPSRTCPNPDVVTPVVAREKRNEDPGQMMTHTPQQSGHPQVKRPKLVHNKAVVKVTTNNNNTFSMAPGSYQNSNGAMTLSSPVIKRSQPHSLASSKAAKQHAAGGGAVAMNGGGKIHSTKFSSQHLNLRGSPHVRPTSSSSSSGMRHQVALPITTGTNGVAPHQPVLMSQHVATKTQIHLQSTPQISSHQLIARSSSTGSMCSSSASSPDLEMVATPSVAGNKRQIPPNIRQLLSSLLDDPSQSSISQKISKHSGHGGHAILLPSRPLKANLAPGLKPPPNISTLLKVAQATTNAKAQQQQQQQRHAAQQLPSRPTTSFLQRALKQPLNTPSSKIAVAPPNILTLKPLPFQSLQHLGSSSTSRPPPKIQLPPPNIPLSLPTATKSSPNAPSLSTSGIPLSVMQAIKSQPTFLPSTSTTIQVKLPQTPIPVVNPVSAPAAISRTLSPPAVTTVTSISPATQASNVVVGRRSTHAQPQSLPLGAMVIKTELPVSTGSAGSVGSASSASSLDVNSANSSASSSSSGSNLESSSGAPLSLDFGTLDYDVFDSAMDVELGLVGDPDQVQVVPAEENALLDQSEDPCLNEGNNILVRSGGVVGGSGGVSGGSGLLMIQGADAGNSPFTDDLDAVTKWLEVCDEERNKS